MALQPQQLAEMASLRGMAETVSLPQGVTAYWRYPAVESPDGQAESETKAIVLVHGYRGNHRGLEAIAGALPDYDLYIPDLPGFGESEPFSEKHSIDAYSRWLSDFITQLQLSKASILAHSFGTIVATSAAAKGLGNPMILVNPISNFGYSGRTKFLAALQNGFYAIGNLLPEKLGNSLLSAPLMVRVMSETLAKTNNRQLRSWIHKQHHDNFSDYANRRVAVEGIRAGSETSIVEFASSVEQRVLLIAGEMDDITSVKYQQKASLLFPNSELDVIQGVGHLTHYETPELVAQLARDFISKQS